MDNNNEQQLNNSQIIKMLNDAAEIYLEQKQELSFAKSKVHIDNKLKTLHNLKLDHDTVTSEINEYRQLVAETRVASEQDLLQSDLDLLIDKEQQILIKARTIAEKDDALEDNCLLEIRPGAGGVEAGLFARDLYEMYCRFADKKGWKIETIESKADSVGNFTFVSFLVKGRDAFRLLKSESGVHRVQRVPVTESKGRLQTSTVSVVVLPETNDVEVTINNQDLRIDTYRSSGSGGQHVNTTDSAIRITHIPTGIVATSQDGRSQHDNKDKALFVLKARLFEKYKNEQEGAIGAIRSSAIGNSERAEKIRTYNFPQNRLTDHRIALNLNKLNFIIEGNLEVICESLVNLEKDKRLKTFMEKMKEKASQVSTKIKN